MPCTKCNTDFSLLTWKIKCSDCEQYYCSKCLRKLHGGLYCEKCVILNKRPPDREKLMELRSKDLRDYLNKNHISTHGLVEKRELVELFYRRPIPVRGRKSNGRFNTVFSGSVPNLATQSQEHIHNIRSNIESNINNVRNYAENAIHNLGRRVGPSGSQSNTNSPRSSVPGQSTPTSPGYSFVFTGTTNTFEVPQANQNNSFVYTQTTNAQQSNGYTMPETSSAPQDIRPQQDSVNEPTLSSSPRKFPKLSDFKTVEELSDLSNKQLKELLTLNRVDYKGCVEKSELLDRATRLWNDNNQHVNEDIDGASVDNLCKICMDAALDCVILECGHMATCVDCGKRLAECPICRQYVTRVVRTFKA